MFRHYYFCGLVWLITGQIAVAQNIPDTLIGDTTPVSSLTDVRTTDWAYEALRSLAERHDCGLSRNPFQGNQSLTRFEFATGVSLCLERMRAIAGVPQSDLEILARLQSEFAAELKSLSDRVDNLIGKTTTLEKQQFSTTTRLRGLVIAAVNAGGFTGDQMIAPQGALITRDQPNATALYRASVDLDTSFSGRDLLKVRLVTGSDSTDDNAAGRLEPNLGSTLEFSIPGRNNQLSLGRLFYTFPVGTDVNATIGSFMVAGDFVDQNRYANNSVFDFSTQALVNNFILLPRPAGAGAAIAWNPKDSPLSLRAVYIAGDGSSRIPENRPIIGGSINEVRLFPIGGGGATGGLFGDPYQGIIELGYAPTRSFTLRAQYGGGKLFGSQFSAVGVNAELALTKQVGVFGRYGTASYPDTILGNLTPQYWMAGVGFRDIFIPQSIGGIAIGQPLIEDQIGNGTQTNMELFYNIPISNRLRITPILQIITNPANQSTNGTIFSGTIRTTLMF
jgi:hypothetical protein